jgi:hypothetical protein
LNAQKQKQEHIEPRYAVTFEPMYLHNGGLRLNLEKQWKQRERLELNIAGYYLPYNEIIPSYSLSGNIEGGGHYTPSSELKSFNRLSGVGVGGTYKRYFLKSCVVNAGISYTYSDIQYPSLDFHKYSEDGLTFYDYDLREIHQYFNTLAVHLSTGIRSSFHHLFFVEYTMGLGYAYSFYDKDKNAYNESPLGFGYKGIYPVISIKLGFNIK